MNCKPGKIEAVTAPPQLYDYVAREFAKVDPESTTSLACDSTRDSLDDWDPLADSQEMDGILLEQYRRYFSD